MAAVFFRGTAFRASFDGCYFNALAGWMFHGRAYAGGRFVFLYRIVHLGTP
jgi:hypothetical protein